MSDPIRHPYYDQNYIYLYILVPFTIIAVIVVIYYVVRESARLSKRDNRRTRTVVYSAECRRQMPYSLNVSPNLNTPPPPYQQHDTIRSPNGLPPPPPYSR